ncbi:MAG: hypothetical protein JXQ27_18715 [Acidobacteria bacterium]|nr:hypothetical protein [Acidobacteriota bacterium]
MKHSPRATDPAGSPAGRTGRTIILAGLMLAGLAGPVLAQKICTLKEDHVWMYLANTEVLTERFQAYVFYVNKGVPRADVIEPGQPYEDVGLRLSSGIRVRALNSQRFQFTHHGLSGALGGTRHTSIGSESVHMKVVNSYDVEAVFIQILDGKNQGRQGWIVNHMICLTSNGSRVDKVDIQDRLGLHDTHGGTDKIWEVRLKNGRVLRTRVLEDKGDTVFIQTELGRVGIARGKIEAIRQVDE